MKRLIFLLLVSMLAAPLLAQTCSTSPCTFASGTWTWTVPSGVNTASFTISAAGGGGGGAGCYNCGGDGQNGNAGSPGRFASASKNGALQAEAKGGGPGNGGDGSDGLPGAAGTAGGGNGTATTPSGCTLTVGGGGAGGAASTGGDYNDNGGAGGAGNKLVCSLSTVPGDVWTFVIPASAAGGTQNGSGTNGGASTAGSGSETWSAATSAPVFSTQPYVSWTSPSSIAASFVTNEASSVEGYCSLTSGAELTSPAGYARSGDGGALYTAGWQRTNFTGTPTAWGNAVAITGLAQNTPYYCEFVATDASGAYSTTSAEFTATTTTLTTTAVIVNATSELTRYNDQATGANGMPNNGRWMNGDTEMWTLADNGTYYGTCHDCAGVNGATSNSVGWLSSPDAAHLSIAQVDGALMSGCPAASDCAASGWTDGGTWESWGIQSIRGQIYFPIWRCWGSYCGDYNVLRSPDHLVHSISAGNQAAQGLGPNAILVSGYNTPVFPAVMPNLTNSTTTGGILPAIGPIQSCQDESLNCTAQANNDGWVYAWGGAMQAPGLVLSRIRVEDLPLLNGAKYQCYDGSHNADDGIYDANWTTTFSACTTFGGSGGGTVSGWNTGNLPNSQFIPDFNRWLFLNTIDNANGGSVVLYDCGPYPWGTQTAIGSVNWDANQWPGYNVSFGQILPGSYLKTGATPLSALLMITTTGTIAGLDSATPSGTCNGPTNCPGSSYSPFIGKLNLVARSTVPPTSQVSVVSRPDRYIANGLDLFYDFRGSTSLLGGKLPNLSPSDPAGNYSAISFTATVAGYSVPYFSTKGMFSFGYPPAHPISQLVTTPYNKTLSAFTLFAVFEHSALTAITTDETPLYIGTSLSIYRNGTTANSWYVSVGSATVGPFTLATDGTFVALVLDWDGTNVKVYSSAQIPQNGYTLPLTTLATGTNTTAISGTLAFGENSAGTYGFRGTMSDFLLYTRHLSDAELVRNMGALRADMASRGVALP